MVEFSKIKSDLGSVAYIEDSADLNKVPLSAVDAGGFFYWKAANNMTPELSSADIGKAYGITTVDASGAVTFGGVDAFLLDDATASIINQAGIIEPPTLSITGTNTINVGPFKAVFFDQPAGAVGNVRRVVDSPVQQTITINAVGSSNQDVTYLKFLPSGSFAQETDDPTADRIIEDNYIVRILHPNGGKIVGLSPVSTVYSNPQQNLQQYSSRIGIDGNDILFSISNNSLRQTGANARIFGYNIADGSGTGNRSLRTIAVEDITADYYSFDSTEQTTFSDLRRTYKLDDPAAGTSSALANFGIIAVYILASGSYYYLAPQKNYSTAALARSDLLFYLTGTVVPDFLSSSFAALLGAIVVPATVTDANISTVLTTTISNISLASSGGGVQTLTIDPSTGTNDDVVGTNGTNFILKKENAFNVTGGNEGDVLVKRGTSFAVEPIANQGVPRFNLGTDRGGFVKLDVSNGAIVSSNGDIASDFSSAIIRQVNDAYYISLISISTTKIPVWISSYVLNTDGNMMPVTPTADISIDFIVPVVLTPAQPEFLLRYILVNKS